MEGKSAYPDHIDLGDRFVFGEGQESICLGLDDSDDILYPSFPFNGDQTVVYDPYCEVCDWRIIWEAE